MRWLDSITDSMDMKVLVTQSCPTLCNSRTSLPGSSVHGILQAKILDWGHISFLQGIFLTQVSNPGLPHCREVFLFVCLFVFLPSEPPGMPSNRHEFVQIPGDSEGHRRLACCSPWGSQRLRYDLATEHQQPLFKNRSVVLHLFDFF